MTTTGTLLEVGNVTKVFTDRHGRRSVAVDDVSLTLAHGGSLAIVGESGSGKTTLSRIIVGLESATSGQIHVDGNDWTNLNRGSASRKARAKLVQMVFQDPFLSLDPRQTVASSIGEVLELHFDLNAAQKDERVRSLLARVGLPARKAVALPSALSGGERQRVAIAKALAPEPKLLILDEAVAALDVSIQAQILNLLVDIRRDTQVSYLFVSHDLSVVRHISESVVVMRNGAIIEEGATEDVFRAPKAAYTRLLLESAPRPGWVPRRRVEVG